MGNHFTHTNHGYIVNHNSVIINENLMTVNSALCISFVCNYFNDHSCTILNNILDSFKTGTIAHSIDKDIGFVMFYTINAIYVIFYGTHSRFNDSFLNKLSNNNMYDLDNMICENGNIFMLNSYGPNYGPKLFTCHEFLYHGKFKQNYFIESIFAQFNVHLDDFLVNKADCGPILWNSYNLCKHVFLKDLYEIIEKKYAKFHAYENIQNIIVNDLLFVRKFHDGGYMCDNTRIYYEKQYHFI
jgi:hypothetical protein